MISNSLMYACGAALHLDIHKCCMFDAVPLQTTVMMVFACLLPAGAANHLQKYGSRLIPAVFYKAEYRYQ